MKRKEELAADRDRIMREGDPTGFLIAVMKGQPVEELDWAGETIGYARPSMDHRVVAARELLRKVIPDLKSVDVSQTTDTRVRFVFNSPIPLPNSEPNLIEPTTDTFEADLDQIEVHRDD